MRSLKSENNRDEESQLRKKENGNLRKRFSQRLRKGLLLLKIKLKGFGKY
jgi:hypothetical protein